jgi:hypothetical protein
VVVVLVSFYNLNEIKSTIKTTYWQRKVGGAPFKLVKNTNSKKETTVNRPETKNSSPNRKVHCFFSVSEKNVNMYLVEDTHQNTDRG